jgi:chromosome segregation ATPase
MSLTEQRIVELRTDFGILRERVETLSRGIQELDAERKSHGNELKELQRQVALLSQRFDDHSKRVETWESRRWALIVAVIVALLGAALSLASGLIVTLARK